MRAKEFLDDYAVDDLNVFGRHEEHYSLDDLMDEYAKIYHESEVKKLRLADVMLRFKLRLNVETWGSYKKGDEDYFYIKLLDEQNGLARFPIDKKWDIVSCKIVNEV